MTLSRDREVQRHTNNRRIEQRSLMTCIPNGDLDVLQAALDEKIARQEADERKERDAK